MDDLKKTFVLCPDKGGCCPKVMVEKNQVVIKDDFGGRVKLTRKEFDLLKEKIISKKL